MNLSLEQIIATFGCRDFPDALFYHFESSLRFELGDEDISAKLPIRRFLQAHHRASSISNFIFADTKNLYALFSSYSSEEQNPKAMKRLQKSGFKKSRFSYLGKFAREEDEFDDWEVEDPDDQKVAFRHWYSYPILYTDEIAETLWFPCGIELGIKPYFNEGNVYLVDFERGVCLHVYDDRGMDLVSTNKADLVPVFKKYQDWLLPYNLDEMETVFGE